MSKIAVMFLFFTQSLWVGLDKHAQQIRAREKTCWKSKLSFKVARTAAYHSRISTIEVKAMIHVVAIITAQPSKRDELLKAFNELVPQVRVETGCIEYQPVIDTDEAGSQSKLGPDTYMVIEKWERMEDLRAHAASSHMTDYAKKNGHLVVDRKVYVLD